MMAVKKHENRYVNDLRRYAYGQAQILNSRSNWVLVSISAVFLAAIAVVVGNVMIPDQSQMLILVGAAVIGGYMALNIGANDVANNMGPAVGAKVMTVTTAVIIAAICESAGALLAGGDVVQTVAKGIISPGESISNAQFRLMMLSALFAAALWINVATILNAPVSTTHSIVGGVLGAGIAAAGVDLVNWPTMGKIAASWVISPVFGAIVSASLLLLIKVKVLNVEDRLTAAKKWVPVLIGLMAAAFTAYMAMKGLKKIWKPSSVEVVIYAAIALFAAWMMARPYIAKKVIGLKNTKKDVYTLFHLPLIFGVALLSFAHGANDVANAVGPLAAIVSTLDGGSGISAKVGIPVWVMVIGALGIVLGLALFGPKLISTVGQKITRLNASRAYCVALSSAITVLIASTLGLPVSSTHIAIGAIFGVGFLREFLENPNRRKRRSNGNGGEAEMDASVSVSLRARRRLVRRRFVLSIATAWVVTVPASALLAAGIFYGLQFF
jgi:PiT family inorganic phosphate transporter